MRLGLGTPRLEEEVPPDVEAPREEEPGARGAAPREPRLFASISPSLSQTGLSLREAFLWSLLAHAAALIGALLLPPGAFRGTPALLALRADEEPVRMTFVQDRPRPAEPNPLSREASDRDRRRAQEEAPKRPSRTEPFSRGNTPARIAEGPLAKAGAPPAPAVPPAPEPPPPIPELVDEAAARGGEIEAREGTGPFYVPPRGATSQEEDLREKGERLRRALSQMGASGAGQGGARFKYDNPIGGLSTPTGSLSFDTQGFDWGPYARRIYWIIWSNWHARMPPAIYAGVKGIVKVHFVIHRDGRITDIEILSASGVPAYDSAAVLALEASSPLPPLPESFPNESDGVTGRFLYNIWSDEE